MCVCMCVCVCNLFITARDRRAIDTRLTLNNVPISFSNQYNILEFIIFVF